MPNIYGRKLLTHKIFCGPTIIFCGPTICVGGESLPFGAWRSLIGTKLSVGILERFQRFPQERYLSRNARAFYYKCEYKVGVSLTRSRFQPRFHGPRRRAAARGGVGARRRGSRGATHRACGRGGFGALRPMRRPVGAGLSSRAAYREEVFNERQPVLAKVGEFDAEQHGRRRRDDGDRIVERRGGGPLLRTVAPHPVLVARHVRQRGAAYHAARGRRAARRLPEIAELHVAHIEHWRAVGWQLGRAVKPGVLASPGVLEGPAEPEQHVDAHAAVRAPGAAHDRASAEVVLGRRAATGRAARRSGASRNIGVFTAAGVVKSACPWHPQAPIKQGQDHSS